ncbi:MAG: DNA topoisomerase VI subunit B [Thermosphaera aggregans]|jgi:DNA topoisomerase-6 subunit B|uniref:DNA topoisomerase VI subunit B n=1 Tax=Thermosphaera aggregans TaxID=54254 RepID=UPI003C02587F
MSNSVEGVEKYRAISPAEFFYKYREIAGFSNPVRALYQTVRELYENALDATDAHGILPDVKISIKRVDEFQEYYRVTVEDNGIGLPPDVVPNAFGKVLFSSKYVLKQTRGMYGLGVKMAVLYGQMTTGRPVEVITSKQGFKRIYYFKLRIDVNRNEPVILERGTWRKSRDWHGTIVSITLEGDWARAKPKIMEYLSRSVVVTPYANIIFLTPENEIIYYPRAISILPRPPVEVKPHPFGVDLEMMKQLKELSASDTVKDLLIKSFQSVGESTATEVLNRAGVDPSKPAGSLEEDELLRIVNAIKGFENLKPPSAKAISPLGREIIVAGLSRMFKPEFVEAVTRRPQVYQGHPFIVEAGVAYGGGAPQSEMDKPVILRYANKIPLLYDEGSDVTTFVIKEDINWANYSIAFPAPIVVLVHVCSTKIPFKGVGKESIADVPEIRREIRLALMEVLRRLKIYLVRKAREEEVKRRVILLAKYIPEMARSLHTIVRGEDGIDRELLKQKLVEIVAKRAGLSLEEVARSVETVEIGT